MMMSRGVSAFIIAIVTLNILACLWLMWWTVRMRTPSGDHAPADSSQKTGHVWDGDLEEYNNPLPRWWLGLFVISVIFSIGYLIFYPGLGNYAGVGAWSSQQQLDTYLTRQRAAFDAQLQRLQAKSAPELVKDAGAMATARNLFSSNCAGCHGSDGRGARGFPNLTDGDWLYGGDEATIKQSIAHGRHGVMPALGSVLGTTGTNEVAAYVLSLSGVHAPSDWIAAGQQKFATLCSGCHASDAKGNALLGAPNLTDKTWLHGGDFASVQATIANGRSSEMPAHGVLLGESQVRLLTAYVMSLEQPQPQVLSALEPRANAHVAAP